MPDARTKLELLRRAHAGRERQAAILRARLVDLGASLETALHDASATPARQRRSGSAPSMRSVQPSRTGSAPTPSRRRSRGRSPCLHARECAGCSDAGEAVIAVRRLRATAQAPPAGTQAFAEAGTRRAAPRHRRKGAGEDGVIVKAPAAEHLRHGPLEHLDAATEPRGVGASLDDERHPGPGKQGLQGEEPLLLGGVCGGCAGRQDEDSPGCARVTRREHALRRGRVQRGGVAGECAGPALNEARRLRSESARASAASPLP